MEAATLLLKGAGRQQQQLARQVAEAVDSIAARHSSLGTMQQQQLGGGAPQHCVYSCLSGAHIQVRLPCSKVPPALDTVVMQHSSSSTAHGACHARVPTILPSPSLQSAGVAAELQGLLPVGSKVSVLVWPSCVWSNAVYVGVTLNCLQVLRL